MRLRSIIKVLLLPHWAVRERARLIDEVNALKGKLVDAENGITDLTEKRISVQDRLAETSDERDRLCAILDGLDSVHFVAPGHYYSPFPSRQDIEDHLRRGSRELQAIEFYDEYQLQLLECLVTYYPRVPFQARPSGDLLYGYDNPHYSRTDGIILFCMINHLRPRRVIEIGSGFSTCAILDTNRLSLGSQMQLTSIDPHPELLRSLLGKSNASLILIESKLQNLSIELFDQLESGDILFVDSSHVSKAGSDVNYVFFEILPRLKPGVIIQIHDIYLAFEYPEAWLREGRAWNESYLLRAFLEYNERFRIRLFISHMQNRHEAWFRQHMPDTLLNKGGTFWMEKL